MNNVVKIRRALISVSDKLGLSVFAQGLADHGVEIYSTGGTRKHLQAAGIAAHEVADYTGFPEMMDGRVKTLHPRIFGGILARRDREDDVASAQQHGIELFDLVVVNLYPFAATARRADASEAEVIEQIDIGGPSLVRAAAKNSRFVAIATSPNQYGKILEQLQQSGGVDDALRRELMAAAFEHTAGYDQAIAEYFSRRSAVAEFLPTQRLALQRKQALRYGENDHQSAALYALDAPTTASIVHARQLNGKELSYNNILDFDAALAIVRSLDEPATCVIKHNNPCGAATAETLAASCRAAFAGDPQSAFGSIVGCNRVVDAETATFLGEGDFFVEGIVAPAFDAVAVEILTTRPKWKNNVRLLEVGKLEPEPPLLEYRSVVGGVLVQSRDNGCDQVQLSDCVTECKPNPELLAELQFAWNIVRHVKSNAITLSRGRSLVGVGAGQMSRVDSVKIAIDKAGDRAAGAILGSDAFFPFADSISLAAAAGISAIVQPGGSVRDSEVIAECNRHQIPMILTRRRHFKH